MLGYPINLAGTPGLSEYLAPYLNYSLNNLGDPFIGGMYGLNTFEQEKDVVLAMSDFFHLPHDLSWGYITSCGSESNLRALSLAKQHYPDGVIYFSEASHYSVKNAAQLTSPCKYRIIRTFKNDNGGSEVIDLDDLYSKIDLTKPVILSLNVGTTFTQDLDPVEDIIRKLRKHLTANMMFVHIDAALSGMMLPFLGSNYRFDFSLDIDSLTISGHKFLGCPMPCGVFLCRKKHIQNNYIDYISSSNNTLFGSRNSLAVLALHYILGHYGWDRFSKLGKVVERCCNNTNYLRQGLINIGDDVYKVKAPELANTLTFNMPSLKLVEKWQLATKPDQGLAHAIVMPHVNKPMIDEFIADMKEDYNGYT
jgi:histidine decarboxylase